MSDKGYSFQRADPTTHIFLWFSDTSSFCIRGSILIVQIYPFPSVTPETPRTRGFKISQFSEDSE